MRFSAPLALLLASLASTALAYAVTGGSVTLNKDTLLEIDPSTQDAHRLTLNSAKDTVSLSVAVLAKKQPHQLMYMLSDNAGLDHAVFARFQDGNAVADISVNKIPAALKKQDRIFVSVIAADSNADETNVNFPVIELVPSETLKESIDHQKPTRLGALPEIHHTFKTDADTVNAIVPIFFSGLAVALAFALLATWGSVLKNELFGAAHGSTWKAALLTTLALFEYTFFQYYLGALIFTTVFTVLMLAGPVLFFGSRALSSLGRSRVQGKA